MGCVRTGLCCNENTDLGESGKRGELDELSPTIHGLHVGTSRDRIKLPCNAIRVVEADVHVMRLQVFLNPIVMYPCRV